MNSLFETIMAIAIPPKTVFASGQGSKLSDDQGDIYIDLVQSWAVNTLGHNHPTLVNTFQTQAQALNIPSHGLVHDRGLLLALDTKILMSH